MQRPAVTRQEGVRCHARQAVEGRSRLIRIVIEDVRQQSSAGTVREDVVVDESVSVADLTKHVVDALGDSLQRCEIFDLYRGKGVDVGRKSIGIGLILQDASRTLNDEETDAMIQVVVRRLEQELEATIRN